MATQPVNTLDRSVISLARPTKALSPDDSVARAAGLLRACAVSALPVIENGRVIGVVTEESVLGLLTRTLRDETGADTAENVPIREALRPQTAFAHRNLNLSQVAEVFASTDEDTLPVVDDLGGFYGVVTRGDLLAYISGALRPTNVAGMATPLGVYLTNGSVRAGAGNFGLFLSGVSLGLSVFASWLIVWGIAWAAQALTGLPVRDLLEKPFVPGAPRWLYSVEWIAPILAVCVIMLIIRLSPLSGYHAAEHMTVHALEVGEELTPASVRSMSRVHARCGTNLLAASAVFLIIVEAFSGETAVLLAMVVVVVGWRGIGAHMQRVATTKTPSERQIANGVRAGKELVARFMEQPSYQAYGFVRLWNTGILQSLGGLASTYALAALLSKLLHFSIPF